MSRPAYDLLLIAHVIAAFIGFGAIAAAGWAASSARRSADPVGDEAVRRFFKKGRDWPARAIFLVPLLGLGLLFGGDRSDVPAAWPWIGLSLWLIATGLASGRCWPAERAAQDALAELVESGSAAAAGTLEVFRRSCRTMEQSVGAISICFVAAVALMILQP
ncbi:MAG: hypothetical protein ABSH30_08200 [Acidimicrobiales bacterium]